jgi:hypothetical protein
MIRTNHTRAYRALCMAAATLLLAIFGPVCAQTQPTRPSAYATAPTWSSAFATSALSPCYASRNPTSPCYSGTAYPSYSAIMPSELPKKTNSPGANSLNEDQVKLRIEAKGYSNVFGLQKDNHGIWRGEATMKNGKFVAVILDLEGNIYSELNPFITIRPLNLRSR